MNECVDVDAVDKSKTKPIIKPITTQRKMRKLK